MPSGDGGHRHFGFGRHKGRAFEDVYRKERDYVKWVQRIPRPTRGLAEFKRFIRQPKSKAVERPEQERDCKGKQLAKADLRRVQGWLPILAGQAKSLHFPR